MPKFTVVTRGSLILSREKSAKTGDIVELSAADAASLPPGTVEPVIEAKTEKAETPKKKEG